MGVKSGGMRMSTSVVAVAVATISRAEVDVAQVAVMRSRETPGRWTRWLDSGEKERDVR
jgi:hypothetical protein